MLKPIVPNGVLVAAQEQDSFNGDFDEFQAFDGIIDEFRVWDHVRPKQEIEKYWNKAVDPMTAGLNLYWK